MDQIVLGDMPPVTKVRVIAVIALAFLVTNGLIPYSRLHYLPQRIWTEPWRVVTLFFFLGDLLLSLLIGLYQMSKSFADLERGFVLNIDMIPRHVKAQLEELQEELAETIERNHTWDFSYFIAQIAVSIIAAVTLLRMFGTGNRIEHLGPVLNALVFHIRCRINPEQDVMILGFRVTAKYGSLVMLLVTFLLSIDFSEMVQGFSSSFRLGFQTFFRSELFCLMVLTFTVGHFWWFVHFFLMGEVYNESLSARRKEYAEAYAVYGRGGHKASISDTIHDVLLVFLLPPWYWLEFARLGTQQHQNAMMAQQPEEQEVDDE